MLADRVRIGSVKKKIYMAQDSDFKFFGGGLRWIGSEKEIEIPPIIHGDVVTSYDFMFNMKDTWLGVEGGVTKIVNKNHNVTSLYNMFVGYDTPYLDLSEFNLSDGVNVEFMFAFCKAETLDLSGFDTSKILSAYNMFFECLATTVYVRTQVDADFFNSIDDNPTGLVFVVK